MIQLICCLIIGVGAALVTDNQIEGMGICLVAVGAAALAGENAR